MFADISIQDFSADSLSYSAEEIARFREEKTRDFDRAGIKNYLIEGDNLLDAKAIMNDFFPDVTADVFLSHAHRDEDDVIKLAIKLESLGLKVFVDSCIWGYADELLKEVDNKFCMNDEKTCYYYEPRNRTTSNVHMILNAALHNMIAKTELLLFVQTKNSLKISNYVTNNVYLSSPWIFSELTFAKLCERTPRRQLRIDGMLNYGVEAADSAIFEDVRKDAQFAHEFPGTQFEITINTFNTWLNGPRPLVSNHSAESEVFALQHLDQLYVAAGIPSRMLRIPRYARG